MEFSNCQLIMVQELKITIEKMKEEGAEFPTIREKCIEEGSHHWLVTNRKQQQDAIGAALYLYAMDEEQQGAMRLLSGIIKDGVDIRGTSGESTAGGQEG